MNLNRNPTLNQLRALVQQCNDAAGNHVLWVSKTGDVAITPVPANQTPTAFAKAHPDLQLRFETFEAGNDYVGADAANDNDWLAELFDRLLCEWPNAQGKPKAACMARL